MSQSFKHNCTETVITEEPPQLKRVAIIVKHSLSASLYSYLQGSVGKCFRCGGTFSCHWVAILLLNVTEHRSYEMCVYKQIGFIVY